jgi:hypothetical protein
MEAREHWIFYLKLTKDLPEEYISLDQKFKKSNKSLIPVTLKSLLECTKKSKSIHVLIVVKSYQEYKYFTKKVKKIMKYLMMTERVHLYIASSFVAINDPSIMKRDYYNFAKLPIKMDTYCQSVSHMIDAKESQVHNWPGGVRPRMSLTG